MSESKIEQRNKENEIRDKDKIYAEMFWNRDQPKGLREVMQGNILTAIPQGTFSIFVGATTDSNGKIELDQKSKEKLSAYRVLALEQGYEIKGFKYNENAGTATASISKMESSD